VRTTALRGSTLAPHRTSDCGTQVEKRKFGISSNQGRARRSQVKAATSCTNIFTFAALYWKEIATFAYEEQKSSRRQRKTTC